MRDVSGLLARLLKEERKSLDLRDVRKRNIALRCGMTE